jgi:hypothetical protein
MAKRSTERTRISRQRFATLTEAASGLDVGHTWRGYGSAIFLEIGRLRQGKRANNPRGEFSIMLEWSWRVESSRRIVFGSWSGDRKIAAGLRSLVGRAVARMSVEGRLPELVVELAGPRRVHSFMIAEGQPRWTVFLPDDSWVMVERGVLIRKSYSDGGANGDA